MKRHSSLVFLSREHHGALILAQLLKRDAPIYKGMPTDTQGKAEYALQFYKEELVMHFEKEEKVLQLVTGINGPLDLLVQTILKEHKELHAAFLSINSQPDLVAYLDILGNALESHVRKEEREVFPCIEKSCSDAQLANIDKYLSADL